MIVIPLEEDLIQLLSLIHMYKVLPFISFLRKMLDRQKIMQKKRKEGAYSLRRVSVVFLFFGKSFERKRF